MQQNRDASLKLTLLGIVLFIRENEWVPHDEFSLRDGPDFPGEIVGGSRNDRFFRMHGDRGDRHHMALEGLWEDSVLVGVCFKVETGVRVNSIIGWERSLFLLILGFLIGGCCLICVSWLGKSCSSILLGFTQPRKPSILGPISSHFFFNLIEDDTGVGWLKSNNYFISFFHSR